MSTPSGITVSPELHQSFGHARESAIRFLKIQIQKDRLVEVASAPISGTEKQDWALLGQHCGTEACYFCMKLDGKNPPMEWLLILYIPTEGPTVREKMLYASARETFKKDLGFSYFCDELYCSDKNNLTYGYYYAKLADDKAKGPLTADEQRLAEESRSERDMDRQCSAAVMLGLSPDVHSALVNLAAGSLEVVQLRVDPDKERVELVEAGKLGTVEDLRTRLPTAEPRFVFLWHDRVDTLVFLYICPEPSPIKLKMLYSTCKLPLISAASCVGVSLTRSIEIRDVTLELTTTAIADELHPVEPITSTSLRPKPRPSRPGKGPRRLVK